MSISEQRICRVDETTHEVYVHAKKTYTKQDTSRNALLCCSG